jgi:hypothetical protein
MYIVYVYNYIMMCLYNLENIFKILMYNITIWDRIHSRLIKTKLAWIKDHKKVKAINDPKIKLFVFN